MKIRFGFVSNSSSSSFCIVGTRDKKTIRQLMEVEGFPFDEVGNIDYEFNGSEKSVHAGFGIVELMKPSKVSKYSWDGERINKFEYVGSCYNNDLPEYAGWAAEDCLKTRTIQGAVKHFIETCKKKFNVDVPEKSVGFFYGESHSE